MSVPFFGRQRELDELGGLIQRSSRARAPAAAVVTGEPGSGKTRLLAELMARSANPRRARVVGFEPNLAVPFAAVGDVIRELSKVPVHGPRLEGLVFGGRDRPSRTPIQIFEAAHRALSAYGPLLIGIDDLQWVDEQSLGFTQYLLRAAEPTHQALIVIAVSRPSSAASTFASTVESLLPPERRAVASLGPMPLEDGVALARSIDDSLDDATARGLWRRAGGSPFWLEALTRSGGDAEPAKLIEERLLALSEDAGSLLAALAVGARPFLPEEIAGLLGWRPDRASHASRELSSRGLGAEVSGTIRPAHDLIREAASASLPVAARKRIHLRVADWIEAEAGDDVRLLREALDHRLAAGQHQAELPLRLLTSPGRRLLSADDLRLLASISDGLDQGAVDRTTIDRALAELAGMMGEVDLALERWARVSEQSAEVSDRRHAETEAALTAYRFGRSAKAHEHLERARGLPAGLEATVRLDALQADVELWLDHETSAGSRSAKRAIAAAEEMAASTGGLDRLSASARRAYLAAIEVAIDSAMQEARDDDIPGLAEECLRISAGLDDESQIAGQIRAAQAMRTVGRPREGEALSRQAWDASKRAVLPMLTVEAGRGLARVLLEMGRLAEAHAVALETRQLEARLTTEPKHWGSAASLRHIIELSFEDAAAALNALRRDAAAELDPHYSQDLHLEVAVWQARALGEKAASEVERELTAAQADADLARCPRHSRGLALANAELLARVGRVEDACRALAAWDSRPDAGRISRDLWRTGTGGVIAAASGDAATAISILEGYTQDLDRAGLNMELIWARIDLGRCLVGVDRDRAITEFTAAADLAERCGAKSEGRLIAQALRALGVRAWRRGAGSAGAGVLMLSKREQEISRRIVDGASNREIADALLLAPKTVERHITNILAKLGARNRTELAGLILGASVRGSPDD